MRTAVADVMEAEEGIATAARMPQTRPKHFTEHAFRMLVGKCLQDASITAMQQAQRRSQMEQVAGHTPLRSWSASKCIEVGRDTFVPRMLAHYSIRMDCGWG